MMKARIPQEQEIAKGESDSNKVLTASSGSETPSQTMPDLRPSTLAQRKLVSSINNSQRVRKATQLQANINAANHQKTGVLQRKTSEKVTGLPAKLKSGIEQLSGYGMGDVRVHHNSEKPAQLQAHAYA
ncbi:MAG TPA: hypothetical protein DCR93_04695, partial [Cytophagales bacterium]|nr:hypothetical protein [Cytophagales bacterium]